MARLLDGVQTLFREHLALAKVELKDDLRRAGRDVLFGAAGVPPLLVGYVLLMVAFVYVWRRGALEWTLVPPHRQALPAWIAFGLVAALNLSAGAALTRVYGKKVRQEKIDFSRTEEELRRDREWLSSLREGPARQGVRLRTGRRRPGQGTFR